MDKQVDIFNQGQRSYGLRDGSRLEPKSGKSVSAEEAETLFKAYPQDIVSPDFYRTGSSDYRDQAAEMQRLREENAALKAQSEPGDTAKALADTIEELKAEQAGYQKYADTVAAEIADLKAQLETAKSAGGTELEKIMNLTNKLQADAISSGAQIKELQDQLTQAQTDATALVTQTQEAGDNALADFKAQIAAATVADEKDIADQIAAYNAALDQLPPGSAVPHFVLTQPSSENPA